ncbi:MAG: hypothetical protein J3K34DRAFT_79348 [Monoraphidium minutum]|nr:MAG: hypothetical protein J3K34DRAFT_79348 [Monoraphidium minutum]
MPPNRVARFIGARVLYLFRCAAHVLGGSIYAWASSAGRLRRSRSLRLVSGRGLVCTCVEAWARRRPARIEAGGPARKPLPPSLLAWGQQWGGRWAKGKARRPPQPSEGRSAAGARVNRVEKESSRVARWY